MGFWNSTPATPAPSTTVIHTPDGPKVTIPAKAQERLKEMRGTGEKRNLWSSDLSVDELLVLRSIGVRPAGMVMGSSVYHVGMQWTRYRVSEELQVLTESLYNARENAMERMQMEAELLGADGIIGVRLEIRYMPWAPDEIEYVAIGTAIYFENNKQNFRTHDNKPFTSRLSGQDFYKLLKSGYRPVGLVMGNCVYHVAHQTMRQAAGTAWVNCELPNFTDALYAARELAQERMDAESEALHAEGIVGVEVDQKNFWPDATHVIEFFTIGTACVPLDGEFTVEEPHLVLTTNS
jgi:uncharacterized protein YbjQ (UPF0145 family)